MNTGINEAVSVNNQEIESGNTQNNTIVFSDGTVQGAPIYNYAPVQEQQEGDAVSFGKYALIALIYAVLHTFCLYRNHSGITYPFYMLGTLILIHFVREKDGLSIFENRDGRKALNIFYMLSLMALSVNKCMTANGAIIWYDGLAITLLLFSFLLHLYLDTKGWDIVAWMLQILKAIFIPLANFHVPLVDASAFRRFRALTKTKKKNGILASVIVGIVLAIPFLLIVVALLASADIVFRTLIENMTKFIKLPENMWDIVGVALVALIAFWSAYLLPCILFKREGKQVVVKKGSFNPVVGITLTALIGFVYVVFSVVQILFLFIGNMTLPANYTYAEYAHEGFYQLLAVCTMNLILVITCEKLFVEKTALKVILTIIGACTYIMIASSAMRMIMYINAYDLTFLRVFTLWFLAVLGLWLAALLIGLYNKNFPVFNTCMVTVTILYLAFVFSNPDYQIARYDLSRMTKEEIAGSTVSYTTKYFFCDELSEDALPAYLEYPTLLYDYKSWNYDDDYKYNEIRKFNFSRYRASVIIDSVK